MLLRLPLFFLLRLPGPSPQTGALKMDAAASIASIAAPDARRVSTVIDFTTPTAAASWEAVDDRIMGGVSRSRVVFEGGETSFEGELVVEGGGFCSARLSTPFSLPRDAEILTLDAAGDGRLGYKLTLRTDDSGVSYQHALPALEEGFTSLRLPLAAFTASRFGRPVAAAPPLRADAVRGVGLMLSRYEAAGGEKGSIAPGGFRLRLRCLGAEESDLAANGRRWAKPAPVG
ncbi:complex I intermediate-associated protein 30-domain-containing protein [Pelagophyceae sp. CCMP2097]|nr:complex I intermediate-associated protein 30-domain-containing protein [Pelagophyceae sp. CCMP2097]